jgi:hypothetical protein
VIERKHFTVWLTLDLTGSGASDWSRTGVRQVVKGGSESDTES